MNTQWRKLVGDFRQHRAQIFLIGAILALGTTAVVTTLDTGTVLEREMARSFRRANSPDLVITFERVEPQWLQLVRRQPGVAEAEARRTVFTKIADRNGNWIEARLVIIPDFDDQRVNIVHQHGADWPAADAGLFIEQSSLPLLAGGEGTLLRVRVPGGNEVSIPVAGIVHDTAVAPGYMENTVYAYASPAVAARLGQKPEPDQIAVILLGYDLQGSANSINAALRNAGANPLRTEAPPKVHPHSALMNALLLLFKGIAAMLFACSAALAAFVVSLWMKRETRQVGIMKTIGARSHQLAGQYLALVSPLLLVTTAMAVTVGTWLSRWVIGVVGAQQNIDVLSVAAPTNMLWIQIGGTLGIPLLAMTVPIMQAARRSAREAIQDVGITAPGTSALTTRLVAAPGDRRWTFSLRNTFRRKWRFALTLLGLGLGGAALLTTSHHYESLMGLIDDIVVDRDHDFELFVTRPMEPAQLTALVSDIPRVARTEAWRRSAVDLPGRKSSAPGQPGNTARVQLIGYPLDTRLAQPATRVGRWPKSDERNAVVITSPMEKTIAGLAVGGDLTVQFRDKTTTLKIVGIVDELSLGAIYTDAATFEAITGQLDRATALRVKVASGTDLDKVVAAVDQRLLDTRTASSPVLTKYQIRENYREHFGSFLGVCLLGALAVATVGALCLIAFAGLNVLERAREIGIIRTLGATPRAVVAMFMAESGSITVLSTLLAVVISIPATAAFNNFSAGFLLVPIKLVFSWKALAVLIAGLPLVMAGVWFTVSRLLRMSVRDTLAYE